MQAQILTHDLARMLHQERVSRGLEAAASVSRGPRGCPLERLARRLVSHRRASLNAAPLAR